MSAADFLDDAYPHGTVAGFRGGCRTNRLCATADSWLSCAAVNTRYASDWVFRKRVDAGATVAELREFDAVEAAAKVQAERDANRRIRDAVKKESKPKQRGPRKSRKKPGAKTPRLWTEAEEQQIRELNAEGLNDKQIAERLGRHSQVVWDKRHSMGLPTVQRIYPKKPESELKHGTKRGYDRGCNGPDCPATPTCGEVGRARYRKGAPRALPVHGTRGMYNRGCKRAQHETCPAPEGITCYEANRRNSRESVRKHRDAKKEAV